MLEPSEDLGEACPAAEGNEAESCVPPAGICRDAGIVLGARAREARDRAAPAGVSSAC